MKTFPETRISPFALRRALRTRLTLDERLLGWGIVRLTQPQALAYAGVALSLIPGVGALIAGATAIAAAGGLRILVLTDRRLMIFRASRRGADPRGTGILLDIPLACIHVTCDGQDPWNDVIVRLWPEQAHRIERSRKQTAAQETTTFHVRYRAGDKDSLVRFHLPQTRRGRTANRLREALVLLAASAPEEDVPEVPPGRLPAKP